MGKVTKSNGTFKCPKDTSSAILVPVNRMLLVVYSNIVNHILIKILVLDVICLLPQ